MVLLAPSWFALQRLIDILSVFAVDIDMSCNVLKTVCMIFNPSCEHKAVPCMFREFILNGSNLKYVQEFKYLGHALNNKLSDDDDIKREIRCMFIRTNILLRRFDKCSVAVWYPIRRVTLRSSEIGFRWKAIAFNHLTINHLVRHLMAYLRCRQRLGCNTRVRVNTTIVGDAETSWNLILWLTPRYASANCLIYISIYTSEFQH